MTGIVKKYNVERGFGFVQPMTGDGPNTPLVYFNKSAISRPRSRDRKTALEPAIPPGAEIQFDLVRGDKGPQCANVRLLQVNGRVLRKAKD
jgi:cold shock CspA family protein